MENENDEKKEKAAIKRQLGAFIAALIILVPFGILTWFVFPSLVKYLVLIAVLPMFYIAISSIKDRISIFRWKRMRSDYARGAQAVLFGIVFLVIELATFIFVLSPLSDDFFNF